MSVLATVDHEMGVAYGRKLRAAVKAIRSEASGNTCGDCVYYRGNWCARNINVEGTPLAILYPSATACRSHHATIAP